MFLVLDLDHFKRVNDLHGHLAGDQLLKSFADTIRRCSPQGACCARIGGDEFALLLDGGTETSAETVAKAILYELSTPVFLGGAQAMVTVSIGLASIGRSQNEEDVLRQSDVALYAAKRAGRNGFAWFDEHLEREITDRLKLEEEIRRGIKSGEFMPFFQPLVDLDSRQIIGFEALARWRSPGGALLEADDFIEAAERTGLVGPLTMSVIEQALKEAKGWPGHLKLAVNISPVEIDSFLMRRPELIEVATVGVPDTIYGEEVVSYVVARPGTPIDASELLRYCSDGLPAFKAPKQIVLSAALPKTERGKLDRKALAQRWKSDA